MQPAMSLRSSRAVAVALVTFATFTDIVAYSIAVPVLPDLSRRLGASPTMIGLLFASFGVTLLDRVDPDGRGLRSHRPQGAARRRPASRWRRRRSCSRSRRRLPWLFAARLVQGAADAVTWVVGFALIADLYGPAERGRVIGIVMSGTSFAFMVGPTLGGWLYEIGGIRLPFSDGRRAGRSLARSRSSGSSVPNGHAAREPVPMAPCCGFRPSPSCAAAVIAVSATICDARAGAVALPVVTLGLGPARIGLVFGMGAVVSAVLHPIFGRLADRWGGRRLTMIGLVLIALVLPLLSRAWSYPVGDRLLRAAGGDHGAVSSRRRSPTWPRRRPTAGIGSFGVAYGLYNVAWGVGLLGGPALGGFLFERIGFARLALVWAPVLVIVTVLLARVKSGVRLKPDTTGLAGNSRRCEQD